MTDQGSSILKPIPRRHFEITPASSGSSTPGSPADANPSYLQPKSSKDGVSSAPSRTRSIINLTSSTLFGIYSQTGPSDREEATTPWGTGAQTPSQRRSEDYGTVPSSPEMEPSLRQTSYSGPSQRSSRPAARRAPSSHRVSSSISVLPRIFRTTLLFAFGVAYGVIITHLHDDQRIAPVRVEGIDRHDWRYLGFWGIAGVCLGSLLPWVDILWENRLGSKQQTGSRRDKAAVSQSAGGALGADWNPVVRSVGAFVGIAFAIRKLPWQSTLQVSLTLALVNPVLWYLIDRSKPGFLLSAGVGLTGTAILLGINPSMVPAPAVAPIPLPTSAAPAGNASYVAGKGALVSTETVGVGTWIASVLFCSCVCFGNIGRRLALREERP
ncbi:MAG: hypothetical protein M1825_000317 [Sarcosagium campestre]|nr:MAG: hypothetical protein M1825_000317 [Sarcosagium campestre]